MHIDPSSPRQVVVLPHNSNNHKRSLSSSSILGGSGIGTKKSSSKSKKKTQSKVVKRKPLQNHRAHSLNEEEFPPISVGTMAGAYAKKALEKSQKRSLLKQREDIILCSPARDIDVDTVLGQGTFCTVYRATALRSMTTTKLSSSECMLQDDETVVVLEKGTQYALKCLRKEAKLSPRKFSVAAADLALEGDILSRLDHENIIRLHGVSSECVSEAFMEREGGGESSTSSDPDDLGYFLVLELLEETLKDRLTKLRYLAKSNTSTKKKKKQCDVEAEMLSRVESMAMGIAKGMEYLAQEQNIVVRDLVSTTRKDPVHGQTKELLAILLKPPNPPPNLTLFLSFDLLFITIKNQKPENVGFNKEGQVKLFDLGFAREVHTCDSNEIAGSLRYMAPEAVQRPSCGGGGAAAPGTGSHQQRQPNSMLASDVYSFGVLLWEICMLKLPFKKFTTTMQFQEKVMCQHWRPTLRYIPNRSLRALICQCWDPNPDARPNFTQIRKELERILSKHDQVQPQRQRRQKSLSSLSNHSDDSSTASGSVGHRPTKTRRAALLSLLSPQQRSYRPKMTVSLKNLSVTTSLLPSKNKNGTSRSGDSSVAISQASLTASVRSDSSRVSC